MMRLRRRKESRDTVAYAALWSIVGEKSQQGVVCDLSKRGLFFRPVGAAIGALEIGVDVRVLFFVEEQGGEPSRKRVEAFGTVRWIGTSSAHAQQGVGVEFESVNGLANVPGLDDAVALELSLCR